MKNQVSPPDLVTDCAVPLASATLSKVHWVPSGEHHDPLALPRDLLHGEGDRGDGNVDDRVDVFHVVPARRDRRADIGLVLVIGEDDLDRLAQHGAAEILRGHARGDHRSLSGQISVDARLVVEHSDLDGVAGGLRNPGPEQ
jgi:hypothetical protein